MPKRMFERFTGSLHKHCLRQRASSRIKHGRKRLCAIRWWAAKIRKPNVVARSNDAYGIGSRAHIADVNKAPVLSAEELNRITDPYSALSLRLHAVFGLRHVESIKIRPDWADRGDKLGLKNTWCMGGREREIPIRTDLQRTVLNEAKLLAGKGSLIPEEMSDVEQLQRFKAQCMKAHISRVHDLRHAYAEQRYKELTGRDCPAGGGKPSAPFSAEEKVLDREARLIISRKPAISGSRKPWRTCGARAHFGVANMLRGARDLHGVASTR